MRKFGSYMCDTYTKRKCGISKRQQPKHIFRYKIMIEINERENHKGFHKLNNVFGLVHYIVKLNFQYQWNNIWAATQTVNRLAHEAIVVGSLRISFSMCSILYTFFHHLITTVTLSYCAVFTLKTYNVDFGIPLSCWMLYQFN